MKIKNFAEFHTLYIFDFDDTIVDTPRFEELISKYLKENVTAKELLDKSLEYIGKKISDLNLENGRIYISDPNGSINIKGNWVRKKTRVYLTSPDKYSSIEESWPTKTKELAKLYNSVKNKCIVTARPKSTEKQLIETLKKLKLSMPEYGIYMRPDNRKYAGLWKGKKIVEILNKFKFSKAIFYDDNSKYIKSVKKVLSKNTILTDIEIIKVN